jgi:hypothetical protein
MGEFLFGVGDKVEKYTGDYHMCGRVVAAFRTCAGAIRYVVEHRPWGILHIYGEAQLRAADTDMN